MIMISGSNCILHPIASGQYDHVITDPPYSPKVHRKAVTMATGKAESNDLGFGHLTPLLRAYIAAQVAAARSWSVIFSDWEGVGAWRRNVEESGGEVVRIIPWTRWSMPQLTGDRPPSGSEAVILAHPKKGKKSWNGPGNFTHFDDKCLRGKGKHKTEKPLKLMLRIVSYFTEEGAKILDPCAGHGTTLKAAQLLGRDARGFEIDPHWSQKIAQRLHETSEKDRKDFEAFQVFRASEIEDIERMKNHTRKIREKRERT